MQTVFEKIIEKLEVAGKTELIVHGGRCNGKTLALGYTKGISDAIEIVKHEAEQYNNGWIPCSLRLPEEHKLYDITFKNSAGIHSDSAIYNPYLKRWLWDAYETELVENEILAWAEKREPYQPKGE